jgi:hypothetical protein
LPSKSPRLNVSITDEQHALLLELAALEHRSAASFLREMVDALTPTLRVTVPILRHAANEVEMSQSQAREALKEPFALLREMGVLGQRDLLDFNQVSDTVAAGKRSERSERGPRKSRVRKNG